MRDRRCSRRASWPAAACCFHEFADAVRGELLRRRRRASSRTSCAALAERHTRYGDSLYLLQPNLKEGAGGLRDYHAAYWAMQATQPSARGRDDFLHLGLLTEEELAEYAAALDFLWRVRNELHLLAGRKNDQMSFELQEQIAARARLSADAARPTPSCPVERFMSDYYRHARAVAELLVARDRAVPGAPARQAAPAQASRDVEDGFRVADGQLEIPHAAHAARASAAPAARRSRWRSSTTCRSRARRGAWCARTST